MYGRHVSLASLSTLIMSSARPAAGRNRRGLAQGMPTI